MFAMAAIFQNGYHQFEFISGSEPSSLDLAFVGYIFKADNFNGSPGGVRR